MADSRVEKLEEAILSIAGRITGDIKADDALKYTQAILNATHAINIAKDT